MAVSTHNRWQHGWRTCKKKWANRQKAGIIWGVHLSKSRWDSCWDLEHTKFDFGLVCTSQCFYCFPALWPEDQHSDMWMLEDTLRLYPHHSTNNNWALTHQIHLHFWFTCLLKHPIKQMNVVSMCIRVRSQPAFCPRGYKHSEYSFFPSFNYSEKVLLSLSWSCLPCGNCNFLSNNMLLTC